MNNVTPDELRNRFLCHLSENLPRMSDERMQEWMDNPKSLQRFLAGFNHPGASTATLIDFAILKIEIVPWQTITLGTHNDATSLWQALVDEGFRVQSSDEKIFRQTKVSSEKKEVDLVICSVSELGFNDRTPLWRIFTKARELGLDLCPAEVGPQLRRQHRAGPKDWGYVTISNSMKVPVGAADRNDRVFSLGIAEAERGLSTSYGFAEKHFETRDRFVFIRPK